VTFLFSRGVDAALLFDEIGAIFVGIHFRKNVSMLVMGKVCFEVSTIVPWTHGKQSRQMYKQIMFEKKRALWLIC
jgi:hypothetical protein